MQPPSGGCVLKLIVWHLLSSFKIAATFGWLCVETGKLTLKIKQHSAATFGWLCVETPMITVKNCEQWAATFGWLCVETTLKSSAVELH